MANNNSTTNTSKSPKKSQIQNGQRLGKGLSALISSGAIEGKGYFEKFDIEKIVPNPYQPRMNINPDELIELADSIREHGVIQPLLITKDKDREAEGIDRYYLIAGERRFRASQLANVETVPVVIKEASPQEMLELALIENVQRQDLNPLEEAIAFQQLKDEFGLTHKLIAQKVGLSRVAVTNKMRLIQLPKEVKEYVLNARLTEGHARALLGISDKTTILATANIVVKRDLSVRDTEKLVRKINFGKSAGKKNSKMISKMEHEWIDDLSKKIGFSVKLKKMKNGGKVEIRYKDEKELEKLMNKLS